MAKYSVRESAMSVAGTEAAYPRVAVAIDNNEKASKSALKWAVEHIIKRGQTIVIVHVNTKGSSNGPCDAAGYKQPDAHLRELFLPYECFCIRNDVNYKVLILDDVDVIKALCEFITQASIEVMVLGSHLKGILRKSKNSDVQTSAFKGGPDFLTVYIIEHSFETMDTPLQYSSSNEHSNCSQCNTDANSSQNMDDLESEIRLLRMLLKQAMDTYSTACRQALDCAQMLKDQERRKTEES